MTTMVELTNLCTCEEYDEETGTTYPDYCFGDCYEDSLSYLQELIGDWISPYATYAIKGFPTWYGTASGIFEARTVEEFIRSITPQRTEWKLTYDSENLLKENTFEAILSHHDGMGIIKVQKFE